MKRMKRSVVMVALGVTTFALLSSAAMARRDEAVSWSPHAIKVAKVTAPAKYRPVLPAKTGK